VRYQSTHSRPDEIYLFYAGFIHCFDISYRAKRLEMFLKIFCFDDLRAQNFAARYVINSAIFLLIFRYFHRES